MGFVMMRSAADFWGKKWPADWSAVVDGKPVLWSDVHRRRKERQDNRLNQIRSQTAERQAAYVWTFFVPGFIYGGWHLYVCTLRQRLWIHSDNPLVNVIREVYPCGLLPFASFEDWKEAFAHTYQSPRLRGGEVQGFQFGWAHFRHSAYPTTWTRRP